jgi:hypothetical protein
MPDSPGLTKLPKIDTAPLTLAVLDQQRARTAPPRTPRIIALLRTGYA